jgi:hypothetical protein
MRWWTRKQLFRRRCPPEAEALFHLHLKHLVPTAVDHLDAGLLVLGGVEGSRIRIVNDPFASSAANKDINVAPVC